MSFLVHNDIDREYIARISQETRILKSSKLDWDVEEVTRFASLLKVD
jgi:6-phosphogluconate dehydrogenase (decarboxylating)